MGNHTIEEYDSRDTQMENKCNDDTGRQDHDRARSKVTTHLNNWSEKTMMQRKMTPFEEIMVNSKIYSFRKIGNPTK